MLPFVVERISPTRVRIGLDSLSKKRTSCTLKIRIAKDRLVTKQSELFFSVIENIGSLDIIGLL